MSSILIFFVVLVCAPRHRVNSLYYTRVSIAITMRYDTITPLDFVCVEYDSFILPLFLLAFTKAYYCLENIKPHIIYFTILQIQCNSHEHTNNDVTVLKVLLHFCSVFIISVLFNAVKVNTKIEIPVGYTERTFLKRRKIDLIVIFWMRVPLRSSIRSYFFFFSFFFPLHRLFSSFCSVPSLADNI